MYTATDNGSVGSTTGKGRNYCADFSGSNYLSIATTEYDIAQLLSGKQWTLSFWHKGSQTVNKSLMGTENSSSQGLDIQINNTQGYLVILFDNVVQLSVDISADDDTWKRIVITCSNDILKLYVDDELVGYKSDSGTLTDSSVDFYLGALNSNGTASNNFTGQLEEFCLFDSPRDEDFIEHDWNDGRGRYYAEITTQATGGGLKL